MALTTMTAEWSGIANEITAFVLRRRLKDEAALQMLAASPMRLYNIWARERGIAVSQSDLAMWCLQYLKTCTSLPLKTLQKAAQYDGITI